ncbi:hypothetical protein AN189_06225 [Loktanella sp. 3ANDIMAR09]|nr:hypothetical protein AN189_06225 [Loktanella sp. 3ANDIMAR09]
MAGLVIFVTLFSSEALTELPEMEIERPGMQLMHHYSTAKLTVGTVCKFGCDADRPVDWSDRQEESIEQRMNIAAQQQAIIGALKLGMSRMRNNVGCLKCVQDGRSREDASPTVPGDGHPPELILIWPCPPQYQGGFDGVRTFVHCRSPRIRAQKTICLRSTLFRWRTAKLGNERIKDGTFIVRNNPQAWRSIIVDPLENLRPRLLSIKAAKSERVLQQRDVVE